MSPSQRSWDSTGSTLSPITLVLRRSKSSFSAATAPSSVVHTGVKSLGWENSTAQLSPFHSRKLILPWVVSGGEVGRFVAQAQCHGGLLVRVGLGSCRRAATLPTTTLIVDLTGQESDAHTIGVLHPRAALRAGLAMGLVPDVLRPAALDAPAQPGGTPTASERVVIDTSVLISDPEAVFAFPPCQRGHPPHRRGGARFAQGSPGRRRSLGPGGDPAHRRCCGSPTAATSARPSPSPVAGRCRSRRTGSTSSLGADDAIAGNGLDPTKVDNRILAAAPRPARPGRGARHPRLQRRRPCASRRPSSA